MIRKGTTLLELVVALGIIITGLLTVVGLIARSIDVGTKSRNEIVALGLAQEGIEAVRAIRDSNSLAIEAGDPLVTTWDRLSEPSGEKFDYTGVPVLENDYTTFPENLGDGPWVVDFRANTITDSHTQIMQHSGGGSFDGLFFQDPLLAPNNSTILSTEYSRLLTLEPICDTDGGTYLSKIPGNESIDFSSAPGCTNPPIGIHVTSKVTWPGKNGTTEDVTLMQDLYDWR